MAARHRQTPRQAAVENAQPKQRQARPAAVPTERDELAVKKRRCSRRRCPRSSARSWRPWGRWLSIRPRTEEHLMRPWISDFRRIPLAACGVALAVALLMAAGATAGTVKAASGSLTMTSEMGDYVGAGETWAYDARTDGISVGSERWGTARAFVSAANGDFWLLQFTTPAGAPLSPGVYANAQRFADDTHPGLDVSGMGRGCNETSGSFTVLDVSYGPYGYLQSLHATFEQRCGVSSAALRGELEVTAPPPPRPDPRRGHRRWE